MIDSSATVRIGAAETPEAGGAHASCVACGSRDLLFYEAGVGSHRVKSVDVEAKVVAFIEVEYATRLCGHLERVGCMSRLELPDGWTHEFRDAD